MSKPVKPDRSQAKVIKSMRSEGATVGKIARHLKIPNEEASRLLGEGYRQKLPAVPSEKRTPSDPKEAREWLRDVAAHLANVSYAGPRFHFVASAIETYLSDSNTHDLSEQLGLTVRRQPAKQGQPRFPLETTVAIIRMLNAGQSTTQIKKALEVQESRIQRVRARRNKLFAIRQHGAKPNEWASDDASELAAKLSHDEYIAMLRAMISAEDIIPD